MGLATLDANCCDFVVGTREVKPEMCKSSSVGTGKKEADRNVSLLKNQMFVRLLFKINRNCYQHNVFFLLKIFKIFANGDNLFRFSNFINDKNCLSP